MKQRTQNIVNVIKNPPLMGYEAEDMESAVIRYMSEECACPIEYYTDEAGVITSCNLGAIVAGGIQNSVANLVEKGIKTNDYITVGYSNSRHGLFKGNGKDYYSKVLRYSNDLDLLIEK